MGEFWRSLRWEETSRHESRKFRGTDHWPGRKGTYVIGWDVLVKFRDSLRQTSPEFSHPRRVNAVLRRGPDLNAPLWLSTQASTIERVIS
jgi:hypothetical protein